MRDPVIHSWQERLGSFNWETSRSASMLLGKLAGQFPSLKPQLDDLARRAGVSGPEADMWGDQEPPPLVVQLAAEESEELLLLLWHPRLPPEVLEIHAFSPSARLVIDCVTEAVA